MWIRLKNLYKACINHISYNNILNKTLYKSAIYAYIL